MDIADQARPQALTSPPAVRNRDGWIIAGYVALALIAGAVLLPDSGGPGMTDGDLAVMAVTPLP